MAMPDARESFAAIAGRLLGEPGVDEGTGFGTKAGLRVGGRIFAMLSRDEQLVVKLPAPRCAELVAAGVAVPCTAGKGRPMREWVVVGDGARDDWPDLARDALAFVGGGGRA
jgi:hypothetical protein